MPLSEDYKVKIIAGVFKTIARTSIQNYQTFVSPLFGMRCRFFPSCSEYASEAVKRYGIFQGTVKTLARLFRCHPFHAGGYDPVSE